MYVCTGEGAAFPLTPANANPIVTGHSADARVTVKPRVALLGALMEEQTRGVQKNVDYTVP